ncbi:MAG: helix-turn-helix domain-containing protein [Acidobacteriaceae bacterium]|nr:helix-turn-helix domain-containing protein [Acidobacteriaceae bacterium]
MPGPAPSHLIDFPESFLQLVGDILRRKTAPHCLVQRARLALLLQQSPHLGHQQAGTIVGLSGRQVQRWRQRWADGDFSIVDLSGRGRKPGFSPPRSGSRQGHRL